MATIEIEGTNFTLSVLPLKMFSKGFWAKTKIGLQNECIDYEVVEETITRAELEEWIFCMFRLLAGAYGRAYSISFEKAGMGIDLYPFTRYGDEVSREERRNNDCIMAIRFLMRSKEHQRLLGGVYSLLFHRRDIEQFAKQLQAEFNEVFEKFKVGKGRHRFAGVSPFGYNGCNYWYIDKTKKVQAGDYVWVVMGRHKIEQIVYVDNVRRFSDDTAPYDPKRVKPILRKATPEEVKKLFEKGEQPEKEEGQDPEE